MANFWKGWREHRRKKQIDDEAERALGTALELPPSTVDDAAKSGRWCRITGTAVCLGGALLCAFAGAQAFLIARQTGSISAAGERLGTGALGLAIAIAFIPAQARAVLTPVFAALGALLWVMRPSGAPIQLFGRVAFYASALAIMAYLGMSGALQSAKWLTDDQRQTLEAFMGTARLTFVCGVAGVTLYRVPMFRATGDVPLWIVAQTLWFTANVVGAGIIFGFYFQAYADEAPNFESISAIVWTSIAASLLVIILAVDEAFYHEHVEWVWRTRPPPDNGGGGGNMPMRQPNNLLD